MPKQTTIRCSACGQPFTAAIRTVIDVSQDPQAKTLLLSGQLNIAQCPNCGTPNTMLTPLLYHDPASELLVSYVPMELNMDKDQQERAIGELMKELPKENFKGYMFSPKPTLTLQGLTELILQADGVTPEMLAEQRERAQLAQRFVEAGAESQQALDALIAENDDKIDVQFFQTLTLIAQRMAESGRVDIAQHAIAVQQRVAEQSTFGQEMLRQQEQQEVVVQEVAMAIQGLGQQAQRSDFLRLARDYQDDDQRLQALVGLVRPAFDYQFFEELTAAIGKAPADERDVLETLRDRLNELTQAIDQQAQLEVQGAVSLLQTMLNSGEDLEDLIRDNLDLIDDTFMGVLATNIEESERRRDTDAGNRLKAIYQTVVAVLQEHMQPELRFVNELLVTETDAEAKAMISSQAKQFGDGLLEVMDAVGEILTRQGQADMAERLSALRQDALDAIND